MDDNIKTKSLTLDQFRKLRWFKLPDDIKRIININTYYRILKWTNKNWPQDRSLEKLRKWLGIDKTLFDCLLKNQLEEEEKKKKKKTN